jgi:hypothetical protein
MVTATRQLRLEVLPSRSAEDIYKGFCDWGRDEWMRTPGQDYVVDPTLPNGVDFERFAADPTALPVEFRSFDLVFPRVVSRGDFEGGGADRVTDDSIGVLVWSGSKWEKSYLLAGPKGWGKTGPDYFSPMARLIRFV